MEGFSMFRFLSMYTSYKVGEKAGYAMGKRIGFFPTIVIVLALLFLFFVSLKGCVLGTIRSM